MHSNKALREYEEEEVSADPLLVLECGHVLPMSSMDGFLELDKVYHKDSLGNWTQPCRLEVGLCQMALVLSCGANLWASQGV